MPVGGGGVVEDLAQALPTDMVIPPYSGAFKSRGQAARARCCFGV